MYSGDISIDFIMLSEILAQFKAMAEEAEQIYGGIGLKRDELSDMSLEHFIEELDGLKRSAETVTDEILSLADMLRKIMLHYQDTEEAQLKKIRDLPEIGGVLSGGGISRAGTADSAGYADYFSGNYIIGEDWLNDISFDF